MSAVQRYWGPAARLSVAALLVGVLAACGGENAEVPAAAGSPAPSASSPSPSPAPVVVSRTDAARFLTQATYGPTEAEITALGTAGYSNWMTAQFNKPRVPHRTYVDRMAGDLAATGKSIGPTNFRESYWAQALAGEDQLRQRATFALAQIFVVSFNDATLANQTRGVTSYYDTLAEHAFGNYRDLLEAVSLHPMMGVYLSSLRNQKEDPVSGRVADENFAREIMQLFTIGLYELNNDGSHKGGTPVETYSHADVQGLAKVFTGWSWYAGPGLGDRTDRRFLGQDPHLERDWRPMQFYAKFHSTSEKKFLGVTIPASTVPDGPGDLKIALDRLFNHPNVGPFIGRQLIQRLVTSNPSPAYVGRVAAAFNNNGSGVRGDMKAVFRAVLLDTEARTYNASSPSYGKLREPLLRLAHLLRAFKATSASGRFTGIDDTDNALGQTPMKSPSVFNYFRPGFTPPNSAAAAAGLVAPELQLTNEVSVASYLNYLRGSWLTPDPNRDIQTDFSAEIALAAEPAALVDRVSLLLMSGQMRAPMRNQIIAAVGDRAIPAPTSTNQAAVDKAKLDRVCIAILLTMASPDYLIQK